MFGNISVDSIRGGIAPFQYSVNQSAFTPDDLFSNISAGKAIITAKDAFNCIVTDSAIIQNTDALKIKIIPGDTTICVADKVLFSASLLSNSEEVQYFWNNSAASPSDTYKETFMQMKM